MYLLAIGFCLIAFVCGQDLMFPQEATDAAKDEIRTFGLKNVLIPEVTKLRRQYLDSVKAAEASPCNLPTIPQLEGCSKCIKSKCLERAADICSTNRYFDAKAKIERFVIDILPSLVTPDIVDLSADQALTAYDAFIQEYRTERRRRAAAVKAPFCPELRQNSTACTFFFPQCSCKPVCGAYVEALEAKSRFQHVSPGFLGEYTVDEFTLDLTSFNQTAGGFTAAKVRVGLAGEKYEFMANHAVLPYNPDRNGNIVAEQAVSEYYQKYPSRKNLSRR